MYAMGVNDQRPVLNGLYFSVAEGKLHTVSCDSFKMATCATETDLMGLEGGDALDNIRFILPNKSVGELYKLLDDKDEDAIVTVYVSRKNIVFVMDGITFFSKLIEGEYIDYNRIILRNHRILVYADRESIISALEHAALITEEKVAGSVRSHVRLEVTGNIMKISATSGTGSSYDEVAVGHEGEDLIIAFNNRYLIDSLRACNADRIKISMSTALSSINIEPNDDDNSDEDLFMLLPVRMKD
jgi:DNA polymerase-3 subunit beta